MNKRTFIPAFITLALACGLALQPLAVFARGGQDRQEQSGSVSINNTQGRVSVKLDRGSKVTISNRYGRINITGWDRDTVEAVATSDKGQEAIQVELTADPQSRSILSLSVPGRQGQRRPGVVYAPDMDFNFDFNPKIAIGVGNGTGVGVGVGGGKGVGGARAPKAQTDQDKEKEKTKTPDTPEAREQMKRELKEQIKKAAESGVILVPMPNVVVRPEVVVTPRPAQAPQPPQPQTPRAQTPQPARPAESGRIDLDVKLPRYAELSAIEVRAGALSVANVDGPVNIASGSSDIKVSHVGAVEIHARSGDVTVEDVAGLAYVAASSGTITVRRSQGDVRAVSINGDIDIQCVKGRVDVSNARGAIKLANISGDVDATTTSSDIVYNGPIQDNGRYRLKSVEGEVRMAIPAASPGFTAMISSYNGDVQTDFAIRTQGAAQGTSPNQPAINRRVEARQGNGQAQITLDSFSKPVRLVKLTTAASNCQ